MENMKRRLKKLIKTKALEYGNFTLSSGKESSYYLDLRKIALSSEGSFFIGNLILDYIETVMPGCRGVAGMSLGADPIVSSVLYAAHLRSREMEGILIRKEPKEHGTGQQVEGGSSLQPGSHILIVDDVATTGSSLFKSAQILEEAGLPAYRCLSLVDREEGASSFLNNTYLRFDSLFKISDLVEQNTAVETDIYEDIKAERKKQDQKWGQDHDDQLGPWDWTSILTSEIGEAIKVSDINVQDREQYRNQMIKIAATAVASLEALDRNE